MPTIASDTDIISANSLPPVENLSSPGPGGQTSSSALKHIPHVDGLRAVCALFVLLHHTMHESWPAQDRATHARGIDAWIVGTLGLGHYAVSLFIVISGFCLMLPLLSNGVVLKRGVADFYKRRIRRILPPYYAALALSLLFDFTLLRSKLGTSWDLSLPVTTKGILLHIFLLHDFSHVYEINGVFWSIAVECQIYVLFPLIVLTWRNLGQAWALCIGLLVSIVLMRAAAHFHVADANPAYIGLFMIGMSATAASFSSSETAQKTKRFLSLPITLVCAIIAAAICIHLGKPWYADYFVGLSGASLLCGTSSEGMRPLKRFLSWKPLVTIGVFSYSLYLVHYPVLVIIARYGLSPFRNQSLVHFALLSSVGAAITIGFAYLFFLVAERPFLNAGKQALSTTAKTA